MWICINILFNIEGNVLFSFPKIDLKKMFYTFPN